MNYAKCATCHGLNSMGFCQYTACRYPETGSGVINGSVYVAKVVTNADRIRSMTDEELAVFLTRTAPLLINQFAAIECAMSTEDMATRTWLGWLKEEGK